MAQCSNFSMKKIIFILLLFSFFACKQKAEKKTVDKGFKLHRLQLGYGAGVVEFELDEKFDKMYNWMKLGDNSCDKDSIYRFQNKQTLFYQIPLGWFDTLPNDTFYIKHFGFNCFSIFVESCKMRQSKTRNDSYVMRWNKEILKQHKESNSKFKYEFDTLLKIDSLFISIRLDSFIRYRTGKTQSTFEADLIHYDRVIKFQFQNTENHDSTWFRNCMKTFESIRFVK